MARSSGRSCWRRSRAARPVRGSPARCTTPPAATLRRSGSPSRGARSRRWRSGAPPRGRCGWWRGKSRGCARKGRGDGRMDLELTGKVAVVGGASKGLGRACAEELAREGAKVAICSRSQGDLDTAAKEIRAATGGDVLTWAGDLDREEAVRGLVAATVERFGRLDILVNNSGGPPLARAHNATEEQWATAVQRSLLFFARMCRAGIPHLK